MPMDDYSKHQQKIITRYYDQRQQIALTKLQELVTELYLVTSDKKREQMWQRVSTHLTALKVPPTIAQHIMQRRDPKVLAANLKDFLDAAGRGGK
jgi:hypothetical protein